MINDNRLVNRKTCKSSQTKVQNIQLFTTSMDQKTYPFPLSGLSLPSLNIMDSYLLFHFIYSLCVTQVFKNQY